MSWLQAIDRLAFTLPRRTPLGLQLPIVPDLQQTDVAPPKRPDVVFELKHGLARFGPGLLVDAIGTVYRFQAYGDERVTLPVGRVPASSVAAMYRARRGGTWRPATESRQNCWYLLAFDPGSTAPDPIASDCEGGGRTTGADNVIAWLHALDEQANKVAGWMVRL